MIDQMKFSKHEGKICPECESINVFPDNKNTYVENGKLIRYTICPDCGLRFKTVYEVLAYRV